MALTLEWGGHEVTVDSVEELDELLDRLTAEAEASLPFMVALGREDGSSLSIGLGREESVASYASGSGDPPYYMARGEDERDEPIAFVFSGETSEFPPWSAVPAEVAREALRVFFRTGELSPSIAWEEV